MPGTSNARNGPKRRIRFRYQRGPSMSGRASGPDVGSGGGPDGADVYEVTRPTGYEIRTLGELHHTSPSDWVIVVLAATTVAAVWSSSLAVAAVIGFGSGLLLRSWRLLLVALLLASVGAVRSEHSWAGLAPDNLGVFGGWARIIDDPQPYSSSTRLIVEIEGERFEVWSRGRVQQQRLGELRGGQWVEFDGMRLSLDVERAHRVAWQHVVGEFEVEWAGDIRPGSAVARASNRVRSAIERAAATLPEPDGALFRGLVVGDDRDQPREMIDRFRASGLSHLTAVSGQNVAFILAACGPLLVRLRPWPRWVATLALIAWFAALTRFEPSIVRAGVMAGLSATAYLRGNERAPVRILAIAVGGLALVDPLLVWSVGFWLSVGATGGVIVVGPWLAAQLDALGPFALPVGITLGAQAGVVIPSVLVFGRLPLVSVPANLLAVPVAGAVMLYGMPAGLLSGWIPAVAPAAMLPARFGTRWVDTVAEMGARLEPDPPWPLVGWLVIAVVSGIFAIKAARRDKNRGLHDDPSTNG
jgi:competence protein ComEC